MELSIPKSQTRSDRREQSTYSSSDTTRDEDTEDIEPCIKQEDLEVRKKSFENVFFIFDRDSPLVMPPPSILLFFRSSGVIPHRSLVRVGALLHVR